jgi:hypothetical protein
VLGIAASLLTVTILGEETTATPTLCPTPFTQPHAWLGCCFRAR